MSIPDVMFLVSAILAGFAAVTDRSILAGAVCFLAIGHLLM